MDAKIECPMGTSDECSMNCNGTCMMNCLPCVGMTREEIECWKLEASQAEQFEQCCADVIDHIPNTLDMLGDQ